MWGETLLGVRHADGAFAYVDSGAVLETATKPWSPGGTSISEGRVHPRRTRGYVPAAAGVAVIDPKILTVLSTIPLQREAVESPFRRPPLAWVRNVP